MQPYAEKAYSEEGETEYSIHGLNKEALADIAVSMEILNYMLSKRIVFERFNGIDLHTEGANRSTQLEYLVMSIKNTLKDG